jgi:serine/threonine-protein kinase
MPMLEGVSLRTLLTREQRIAPDRAIQIARQIAEGLDYAHHREILHRDIKPDNLWITPTGDIKLLDFGLARTSDDMAPITKAGTVLGTPSYMSPEQVTGKPLDGRSDLFSVGVVLVEMLTGQSPFQKTNLFSTLMSVAGEEISIDELDPKGEIPQGLREVVRRLLKKNTNERIGSAGELVGLLDQVQMSPQTPLTLRAKASGSRWWKTIAATLVGFAICLGGMAIWNATDKGTLVVQTDDPTVEVKIANERVTIHDPVTDRNYEIRIGETPLPSGVYQLETTDSTGELVFS